MTTRADTPTPMTCERFAEELSAYLEQTGRPAMQGSRSELDLAPRAAVEAHARACDECGALLLDLQAIRDDAAALPTLAPSRDLWAGIAERIEAPVISLSSRTGEMAVPTIPAAPARRRAWLRPGLAAAALVLVTAGVTHVATRRSLEPRAAAAPVAAGRSAPVTIPSATVVAATPAAAESAAPDPVRALEDSLAGLSAEAGTPEFRRMVRARVQSSLASLPAAPADGAIEAAYGEEIDRLRRLVRARRTLLDTATVSIIDRNLAIIDTAIAESRAALRRDPASGYLTEQLNKALEQKVELLRTAVSLPTRS